jgi:hypothetical protein
MRQYMGMEFLDFLRSGEKDIQAFADCHYKHWRQPRSGCFAAVKSSEIKVP